MPRLNESFTLTAANPHVQLVGAGTIALEKDCTAVLISATASVNVVFDGSTPSGTNGIAIIGAAQPVLLPLGYHANSNHNIKVAAGGTVNVVQLA
jgi:hypothetical protein